MELIRLSGLQVDEKLEPLIREWVSRTNDHTKRAYAQDMQSLARWDADALKKIVLGDARDANLAVIRYKKHLESISVAPKTINRRLSSTRSLVSLAKTLGICNHTVTIKNVRSTPYLDTRGPGTEAVKAMLRLATEPRDRAMVCLLYNNALRCGEVLAMNVGDVNLERQSLAIVGKGQRERKKISASSQTINALRAWLRCHPNPVDSSPLFVSRDNRSRGTRLSSRSMRRIINKLGRKANTKATPHGLRHTAITDALEATGGDIRRVRLFSRHKDINTVLIYDDARQNWHRQISEKISIG